MVEETARKAGVTFGLTYVTSDHPYAAIIEAAKQNGCDLIVMASHGRRGPKAVLLGSETQKVPTHSRFVTRRYLAAQFSSMANAEAVARTLKAELKVHVTVAPVTGAR